MQIHYSGKRTELSNEEIKATNGENKLFPFHREGHLPRDKNSLYK